MESGVDCFFLFNIDYVFIEGMLKMEEDYLG